MTENQASLMRLTVWMPIISTILSNAIEHCVAIIAIWEIWMPNQSKSNERQNECRGNKRKRNKKVALITIRNDAMENSSWLPLLTIVNITKILITFEICIYLPSEHQHHKNGNILRAKKKINGIFHYTYLQWTLKY